jgi:hypothetical protein
MSREKYLAGQGGISEGVIGFDMEDTKAEMGAIGLELRNVLSPRCFRSGQKIAEARAASREPGLKGEDSIRAIVDFWTAQMKPSESAIGRAFVQTVGEDNEKRMRKVFGIGLPDPDKLSTDEMIAAWMKRFPVIREDLTGVVMNENGVTGTRVSRKDARSCLAKLMDTRAKTADEHTDPITDSEALSLEILTMARIQAVMPIIDEIYPGITGSEKAMVMKSMGNALKYVREHKRLPEEEELTMDIDLPVGSTRSIYKGVVTVLTVAAILSLLTTACGAGPAGAANPDSFPGDVSTAIAETEEASDTQGHEWRMTATPVPPIGSPESVETATYEPTVEATPAGPRHPEFSKEYQPAEETIRNYVVEIHGMEIPMDIGITHSGRSVVEEINLSPEMAYEMVEMYLKASHERYVTINGNKTETNEAVTYEEYLEMLRNGEGQIDMAVFDETGSRARLPVVKIEPTEGLALSFTDKARLEIEVAESSSKYHGLYIYLGTDGQGKLVVGLSMTKEQLAFESKNFDRDYGNHPNRTQGEYLDIFFMNRYQNVLSAVAVIPDRCLQSKEIGKTCPNIKMPNNWQEWHLGYAGSFYEEIIKPLASGEDKFVIEIVYPEKVEE